MAFEKWTFSRSPNPKLKPTSSWNLKVINYLPDMLEDSTNAICFPHHLAIVSIAHIVALINMIESEVSTSHT
jgi:hypothetical protein